MAHFRVRASGSIEATIRRKALPEPLSLTFDSMEKAQAYCREAEALIDAGTIPPALLKLAKDREPRRAALQRTLGDVIDDYQIGYAVNADDVAWLRAIAAEVGTTRLDGITVQWAAGIIKGYKIERHLKPATIRHRIGALRRCFDWASTMKGDLAINPLRLLPERYAVYNEDERRALALDNIEAPDADNERDRRLEAGEEERIRQVLALDPEYIKEIGKQRTLNAESSVPMTLLFELAVETAMRLRELFTLTTGQIDLERKTIFLDKTKNGSKRQVPLSSVALAALAACDLDGEGRLFPMFWNGDLSKKELKRTTGKLSQRWATVARLAKCDDLHFHDLRHEATARIYERTTLTDLQIAKITGHKDLKSLARYANLRASTLADKMW